MKKEEDGTFLGKVVFQPESYQSTYEITFFSKRGRDWDYSLHFTEQSGNEEEMLALDERIEQDDEWFDTLLDAALNELEKNEALEQSE
ncbi:hypothetical protein [Paenibacillus sp. 481]|uniref:hypothetical protein n=1 Tax=Paenibacillus sp. 481 TaxID=2835869 RepID=UPI001E5681E8|nr:hypothetical protein [Paenibacillus sp. 481]